MVGGPVLIVGEEIPLIFSCEDANLIGVLHKPSVFGTRAVLMVVGGPQTRVGSHRQFVLLARHLAATGIAVFRFDYRGMGDSEGLHKGFEHIAPDISAAIDLMWMHLPGVEEIVLWGLCDAASAAVMYAHQDQRVTGIVLLNPWVRSEDTEARVYLERYYLARFFNIQFWKRFFSGEVDLIDSVTSLVSTIGKSIGVYGRTRSDGVQSDISELHFIERMLRGMESFSGCVLLIISGDDLTAAEFNNLVNQSKPWNRVLSRPTVTRRSLPEATPPFSRRAWRNQVADWCSNWLISW